jgi:hypothetical protein
MLKLVGSAIAVVFLAIVALWFYLSYQPAPDKRAFINGQVLSMDAGNSIAEAVLIDQGRIVAVGNNASIQALIDDATMVTDLAGKTLMPGIVDAHSHFPGTGLVALVADLNSPPIHDVVDMQQLLLRMRHQLDQTPAGKWVIGIGYDDTALTEMRHPTRAELDQISSERPIFLWHISGHLGVVNSAALQLLGYDVDTPNPEGGTIERDPASGELNGLLKETALFHVQALAMDFGLFDAIKIIQHASARYARMGVTTSQSGGVDTRMAQGLALAARLHLVPFRQVVFGLSDSLGQKLLNGSFDAKKLHSDYFKLAAVKLITDGSIQGYTGQLSRPYHSAYHGNAQHRGEAVISPDKLASLVETYHAAGLQLAIHANGDAAIDSVIAAFRAAQARHPRSDPRLILVHAQMARDDQLDAMLELGITPSFFSAHTYYWGDRHRDIFMGPERAARMSPTRSALDRGLRFSVHLDSPVVPMNPMLLVWSTVNRVSSSGAVIGEAQRIEPMQALRAVTIDAAWQVFEEDNRGSLEPGKWADMIVLSGDPLTNPQAINRIEVLETIVGGRSIYRNELAALAQR